jgi:hypothetical protein
MEKLVGQKMTESKKEKLCSILGHDLVEKIVKDQYNTVNDLEDRWDKSDFSCRVSLHSVNMVLKILEKINSVLEDDFEDLNGKMMAAIEKLPPEKSNNIDELIKVTNEVSDNWKLKL